MPQDADRSNDLKNKVHLGTPELSEDKWHAYRASADDLGRGQKLYAAAGQSAALAGAIPENLLMRRRNQALLRLNVRFTPKSGHQSWLGLRSRSKTGSLALSLRFIRVGNFAARGCKAC
jgi:hypothetical protein